MLEKPPIFISCGQFTQQERQLGKDISALVERICPDFSAYFAQNQSTVEGLSANILRALHNAAGFICVMHRRGEMTQPDGRLIIRGSVWIEQEIAIAAFMHHALRRPIPTLFYCQEGISLEGIRSVLLMNPRLKFSDESQILSDLGTILAATSFAPYKPYDLDPVVTFNWIRGRSTPQNHFYSLVCDVKNTGEQRVTDFQLCVYFPRKFLQDGTTWVPEDKKRSTESHICFVAEMESRGQTALYPGQSLDNPLEIEYFVDNALFMDPLSMMSSISVELFSDSMPPKKSKLAISQYHNF